MGGWFAPSIGTVSRGKGDAPSTAKAAYRAGVRIVDERTGLTHDYRARSGVEWSGMAAPDDAPDWAMDRAALWNAAEVRENRKNSVVARELLAPLPAEVSAEERQRITEEAMTFLVERYGVAVDASIHWPSRDGDERNHHAHILFTTRSIDADGWGDKTRVLDESVKKNANGQAIGGKEIEAIRAELAAITNRSLERSGSDVRVDHRSYERQGIDREAEPHLGPVATEIERRGEQSEKGDERRDTKARNAARDAAQRELDEIDFLLDREDFLDAGELDAAVPGPAQPRTADELMRSNKALSLDTLTAQHSTFTRRDMARLTSRHTDHVEEFAAVLAKLEVDPQLVRLGKDDQDQARFTTRAMQAIEQRMDGHAEAMNGRNQHRVSVAVQADGITLGEDQKAALHHVLKGPDLSAVIGFAGSGKSTMLDALRRSYEQAGYRVQGAAPSGIATDSLQQGAGIDSRTIHSRLFHWDRGKEALNRHDVLVMDEAGMVGSRIMERVLGHANKAGAKVVLVGDVEQLQAIDAGGAMRSIINRTGAAEISTIRRQKEDWQQQATRELATARTGAALERYDRAGRLHGHDTTDEAKAAIIQDWKQARKDRPDDSQIILAFRRDDVRDLNQLARDERRAAGELGPDRTLQTGQGAAAFAAGDRIYFLKNDRTMGVRNGSLATIQGIERGRVSVRLDDQGRQLTFSAADYSEFAHGYAATIHKSQGVTVDRAHVLATYNLDRHAAYVGMSRHRAQLDVHWAKDDIRNRDALTRILSRERLKDTSLDYGDDGPKRPPAGRPAERGDGRRESRGFSPRVPPANDRMDARPPRPEPPRRGPVAGRSVEQEKARFDQWANTRRAELQSQTHDAVMEQGRSHQNEIAALNRAHDQAHPERKEQESTLAAIGRRQQQGGMAGLIYRMSGNAQRDQDRAESIQKTAADRGQRHAERVQVVTNRHDAERAQLAEQQAWQQAQLEDRISRALDRRERDGWRDDRVPPSRGAEAAAQAERSAEGQNRPVDASDAFNAVSGGEMPEATQGPGSGQETAASAAAPLSFEERAVRAAATRAARAERDRSFENDRGRSLER